MKYFDYDDMNLIPDLGILDSRSEADTKTQLGKHTFNIPVVPANMSSVINEKIAIELASRYHFYIMHRFNIDTVSFVQKMKDMKLISSISIGVTKEWYSIVKELSDQFLYPDYITIDIAHGHSNLMKEMLLFVKKMLPNTFIIAGNISTVPGANFLQRYGADAVKVGIGPGEACITYHNTGFGSRNMQAYIVKEIAENTTLPIIADGNIKYPGDINKAIILGATMCMAGGLFSNLLDSPNSKNIIEKDNKKYIEYWGSASEFEGNKTNRIEGTKLIKELIDRTHLEQMYYIKDGIQSGISYAGGKDLSIFNETKYYIR